MTEFVGQGLVNRTYPTLPSPCPLIHPVSMTTREWKGYGHLCTGERRKSKGREADRRSGVGGQMFHGHALRFVSGSSRHSTAAFWWLNPWCFWASWSGGGDDYKMMGPSVPGQEATGVLKPRVRWQLQLHQYRRILSAASVWPGRSLLTQEYEICKLKNTDTR